MICPSSFGNFLDLLVAFTCTKAAGNLWSICFRVNILRLEWSEKPVPLIFTGNILLSKPLRIASLLSKKLYKFYSNLV